MTQPKFKIKKGDRVQVTVGKDKGKQGLVSKILLSESKAIVEGVNLVTRHQKPSQVNPSGSIQKNLPIHISNLALIDPSTHLVGRVGYKMEDGQKVRFFKKSGQVL